MPQRSTGEGLKCEKATSAEGLAITETDRGELGGAYRAYKSSPGICYGLCTSSPGV